MVITKRLRLLLLVVGIVSFQSMVHAVGLGSIQVRSHLNQLLDAVIPLTVDDDLEFKNTFVALADIEDFKRAGLNYSANLGKLRFKLEHDDNGAAVVHITSGTAIREPYISFLLAVTYPNGKALREYTLLLDPPVYEPVQTLPSRSAPAYAAPVESNREAATRRVQPEVAHTPAAEEVPEAEPYQEPKPEAEPQSEPGYAESGAANPPSSYYVNAGDTLYAIALEMRKPSDVSVNQMMLALFRNNPDAFFRDNINNLKQGVELSIPDSDEVASLDRDEVNQAVRTQNQLWEAYRRSAAENTVMLDQSGRQDVAAETGESVSPKRFGNRLSLVPAENEGQGSGSGEGKALQQELARTQEELTNLKLSRDELNDRVSELEGVTDSQKDLLSLKDAEIARLQAQLSQQRESLADNVEPETPTGAQGLESDAITAADGAATQDNLGADLSQTEPGLDANPMTTDSSLDATGEETDTANEGAGDEDNEAYTDDTTAAETPDADTSEAPVETVAEPVETAPESGMSNSMLLAAAALLLILLAGGGFALFKRRQAGSTAGSGKFSPEALVSDEVALLSAVEENPEDASRRLALLRHYHAQGETQEFVAQAGLLKTRISDEDDPIWSETLEMGREIAPEDELFLDLSQESDSETAQADPQQSTDAEPTQHDDSWSSLSGMADSGNGEAPGDSGASDQESDWEDLPDDFDFDSLDDLDEANGDAAQADAEQAPQDEAADADSDGDHSQDLDGDLDFALDGGGDSERVAEDESLSPTGLDDADEAGIDFESNLETELDVDMSVPEVDASAGGAAAEGEGLDESIESLDEDAADDMEFGEDLDTAATPQDGADAVDVELGDEDLFAAEDSVETKLSLAEAYLDMGDHDGAKSMLDEIAGEGSDAQRERAKALMERL